MRTNDEIKITSADWVFIFFFTAAVFVAINYLLREQFVYLAKYIVIFDIYISHYFYSIVKLLNVKIDFFEEIDIIFYSLNDGFFDQVKYNIKFEKGIDVKLYNFYNGRSYLEFQRIFDSFYFFNLIIILSLFYFLFKIFHSKKNMTGIKIPNKQLKSYYDKIIKIDNRKGIGKNNYVVTNDHQPPGLSHNPNYIDGSIKLSLLNSNDNFWNDIKKIQKKIHANKLEEKKSKLLNKDKEIDENEKEIKKSTLTEVELEKLNNAKIIKKYYSLPTQYNKKKLVDVKKELDAKKEELSEGDTLKLSEVEKEVDKYYTLLQKPSNKRTKEDIQFLKQTKIAYSRNIEEFNKNYDEGVFLTPSYYILHPKEGKVPKITNPEKNEKIYETPGINIIIELLYKYILDSYEPEIKKQIEDLKGVNKKLNTKNDLEAITYELNMQIISEFEKQLDENDKKSRVNALIELSEKHKYEETYVLGMWEYANTITNLPTGPLAKIKWINPVLWYAFTSLKRPSVFLIGAPIYVMYLYEKEGVQKIENSENEFNQESMNDYMKEVGGILKEKGIL